MATMKAQLRRLGLGHDRRRSFATIDPELLPLDAVDLPADLQLLVRRRGRPGPADRRAGRPVRGRRARRRPTAAPWAELTGAERADVLERPPAGLRRPSRRSTGARAWAPCWPTRRSPPTAAPSAATSPSSRRNLRQWMMRITAYADRLLADLDRWTGPSRSSCSSATGSAAARAPASTSRCAGADRPITVFTTRPDTLFGATYMVLAPEHPLVDAIVPAAWPEDTHAGVDRRPRHPRRGRRRLPQAGRRQVRRRAAGRGQGEDRRLHRRLRRQPGQRRAGAGLHRRLRPDGLRHRRDHGRARARRPRLRLRPRLRTADALRRRADRRPRHRPGRLGRRLRVVRRADRQLRQRRRLAWTAWAWPTPRPRITAWLAERGIGEGTVNYRLRDWLFSRQRYWGEPFPIVYDEDGHRPRAARVDAAGRTARGRRLLARAPSTRTTPTPPRSPRCPATRTGSTSSWTWATAAARARYRRETNTMPNWAGSCWYELRYLDPHNSERLVDPGRRGVLDGPARGPAGRRRRPVRRRRRARRPAPAVRPLLAQGAVRPGPRLVRRAVPQAVQPGHDPGVRLPRRARHRRARGRGRGARRRATSTRASRSPGCWARWASR